MSELSHGDEARRALDAALAYFRPHPRTQGPVMLTPEKMRAHLAVIEAALCDSFCKAAQDVAVLPTQPAAEEGAE